VLQSVMSSIAEATQTAKDRSCWEVSSSTAGGSRDGHTPSYSESECGISWGAARSDGAGFGGSALPSFDNGPL
jgi:hypothetical protein